MSLRDALRENAREELRAEMEQSLKWLNEHRALPQWPESIPFIYDPTIITAADLEPPAKDTP